MTYGKEFYGDKNVMIYFLIRFMQDVLQAYENNTGISTIFCLWTWKLSFTIILIKDEKDSEKNGQSFPILRPISKK